MFFLYEFKLSIVSVYMYVGYVCRKKEREKERKKERKKRED